MRTRLGVGIGLLGLLLALPPAAGADDAKATAARVAQLVKQLGSNAFAEREAASKQLEAIGPPALDALRPAANAPDPEVKRRARELVQRLERRAEAETVLAPTKVHLVCKDTPVAEALTDLAKKSGVTLAYRGDRTQLAQRK